MRKDEEIDGSVLDAFINVSESLQIFEKIKTQQFNIIIILMVHNLIKKKANKNGKLMINSELQNYSLTINI